MINTSQKLKILWRSSAQLAFWTIQGIVIKIKAFLYWKHIWQRNLRVLYFWMEMEFNKEIFFLFISGTSIPSICEHFVWIRALGNRLCKSACTKSWSSLEYINYTWVKKWNKKKKRKRKRKLVHLDQADIPQASCDSGTWLFLSFFEFCYQQKCTIMPIKASLGWNETLDWDRERLTW